MPKAYHRTNNSMCRWISQETNYPQTQHLHRDLNAVQFSDSIYDVSSCILAGTNLRSRRHFSVVLSCWVTKAFSPGLEPRPIFWDRGLCFSKLPTGVNNSVLGSSLVMHCYRATENISTGTQNLDQFFGVMIVVPVISSSKQTTLVFTLFCWALVSKLQKPSLPGQIFSDL